MGGWVKWVGGWVGLPTQGGAIVSVPGGVLPARAAQHPAGIAVHQLDTTATTTRFTLQDKSNVRTHLAGIGVPQQLGRPLQDQELGLQAVRAVHGGRQYREIRRGNSPTCGKDREGGREGPEGWVWCQAKIQRGTMKVKRRQRRDPAPSKTRSNGVP